MDRVCYIFGAGFSAPLGLPVMDTFITKSKDMFAADPQRFAHFQEVFEQLGQMSVSKNYFNTDLFNVEEILSILEMQSFLQGNRLNETFIRYIKEVIEHHTPAIDPYQGRLPSNWHKFVFGRDEKWLGLGYFVSAISNLIFEGVNLRAANAGPIGPRNVIQRDSHPNTRYSVVTLNYDRVLERVLEFLTAQYSPNYPLKFNTNEYIEDWSQPNLAKLHGSTDARIIPPTWSKGIHSEIAPVWNKAYDILVNSNHIRFIGYSLPTSDAYVRYLLKAATLKAPHIKSIDVICLDSSGAIKSGYDQFVNFKFRRFANARTEDYLKHLLEKIIPGLVSEIEQLVPVIEEAHEKFMQEHSIR